MPVEWTGAAEPVALGDEPVQPKTKKRLRNLAIAGVVGFGLLQVFPAKIFGIPTEDIGTNPPQRHTLDAPPEVEAILNRSCFDCHSNETRWPLYRRMAPGSRLMAREVNMGRWHMNFPSGPTTTRTSASPTRELLGPDRGRRDAEVVLLHPMHLYARLSHADKATLKGHFLKHKELDARRRGRREEMMSR